MGDEKLAQKDFWNSLLAPGHRFLFCRSPIGHRYELPDPGSSHRLRDLLLLGFKRYLRRERPNGGKDARTGFSLGVTNLHLFGRQRSHWNFWHCATFHFLALVLMIE